MGLDGVELVMEVEKTFDIKIPDVVAQDIVTVGDLHNVVWEMVKDREPTFCGTQVYFYKLRRAVVTDFNYPIQEFRPSTSLEEIFPEAERREVYSSFSKRNHIELPSLRLNRRLSGALDAFGIITIAVSLIVSLVAINFFDVSKWSLLTPVAGIAATVLLSALLNPFRTTLPVKDVRRFTEKIFSLNYAKGVNRMGLHRREVEVLLNHLIVEKLGVEEEEVQPDKSFADDLGMD